VLSGVRFAGFSLHSTPAAPNLQHNELRTRRPMW